ncbi:MAG: hypothetical protein D6710_09640 [Nitrospirae bacterium]|nr:MAG: hypothetical protein D6710_09640 [Nitrospirota bacterium]
MSRDIWIFLFSVALFCLNWPVLKIFQDNPARYLFSVWVIIIIVVFNVTYKMDLKKNTKNRKFWGG